MTAPGAQASEVVRVVRLVSQIPPSVQVAGREPIRLSWRWETADPTLSQLAYEIGWSSAREPGEWSSTGRLAGDQQIGVPAPGGTLTSRELRLFRIRIETGLGWSDWSPSLRVEAGLLSADDWVARPITLPDDPGSQQSAPSPILRREFDLAGPLGMARLHVTALGVHVTTINGRPVTDDLLAPGWTPYERRLLADTYDVTDLLVEGTNVIASTIGDGWYRGRLGWNSEGDRGHYGRQIGLIAQLEVHLLNGEVVTIATDESWRADTGSLRAADLYDGSVIDLREDRNGWDRPGFDDSAWRPARVLPFDASVIEPRTAPPVRRIAELPILRLASPLGRTRLDAGQNVSGWVRLTVRGGRGSSIVVRHAEVLEPDGSLHTRSLRSAKATDAYTLADSEPTRLEPLFTFHGFRYVEVETDAEIIDAVAIAISSDTPRRGWFSCADPRLERLHENAVWSQRDNFVSVPTDCPQRDERLGWTGDAQAFASTASTLFDAESFWRSWLRDLALEQDPTLGVPSVVPDVVLDGVMRYGRAGWADAATLVPWAVYESFGDDDVIRQQLPSMRSWVESLAARQGRDGLLPSSEQFGDWLDPDAPSDRPWLAKADSTYLANAYFSYSARLVADALDLTGRDQDVPAYRSLADDVARLTWRKWRTTALTTQTGCAVALQLRVAPEGERNRTAATLARLVREADGRVSTGFLGTPLVLPALAAEGYFDECYRMLLRDAPPSWLYQVARGATTIWERWDAILPDGSIHPGTMAPNPIDPNGREGQMMSFNHYAYGAVVDWMYRYLAGIAPDRSRPGYQWIRFAPRPPHCLPRAAATIDTAFGEASIAWATIKGMMSIELTVPTGAIGFLDLPTTDRSVVTIDGNEVGAVGPNTVGHGKHEVSVTEPLIALRG